MAIADGWRRHLKWLGRHSVWPYLFLVGVALLGGGVVRTGHILSSPGWPSVAGEVISSHLSRGPLREGVARASLELTYTYTVNGAAYAGHRIRYAGAATNDESIRAMRNTYRKGAAVTVYYHPDDPAHALLDPSFSWRGLAPLYHGMWVVGLAILGFVRRWRLTATDWFDAPAGHTANDRKMTFEDFLLGLMGLLTLLGIPFLWWALMKMYAGR
ncbi:MAG: DUF3592 domain-containing protein [Desulfosarcinaceae bacterium]|nr:DUF3592 domain-containing protein [Desulfosarcinaceae bacterium]